MSLATDLIDGMYISFRARSWRNWGIGVGSPDIVHRSNIVDWVNITLARRLV
jgi:hypothetical protein